MARKKKRETENETLPAEEAKTAKNNVKASIPKPSAKTKRRKVEEVTDNLPKQKTELTSDITEKRKSAKKNLKSTTLRERKVNKNESTDLESEPKKETVTRKRTKSKLSETKPELKNVKVALKRLKIEDEINHSKNQHCSPSSSDSGILSDQVLKSGEMISAASLKSVKTETPGCSKDLESSGFDSKDSSSESEWEEVEDSKELSLDDYNPVIPKEGVEITIDCPDLKMRRRKKKEFDEMEYVRLYVNRMRKEAQLNVYKTHLLCLLAHGFYVNDLLNSPVLKGMALSLLPSDIITSTSGRKIDKLDVDGIERIAKWFCNSFSFETEKDSFVNISSDLVSYFETKKSLNASEYNLMFIVFARTLGFKARFCVSLYTVSHKAQNLIKKRSSKKSKEKDATELENSEIKQESENSKNCSSDRKPKKNKASQNEKPRDEKKASTKKLPKSESSSNKETKTPKKAKKDVSSNEKEKKCRPRRSAKKSYKLSSGESDDDEFQDEDFKYEEEDDEEDFKKQKPLRKSVTKTPRQKSNRKILSSDSEPSSPDRTSYAADKVVCWVEVFSKPDKQWIPIDCVNNIINKPYDIEANVPQPVTYILAYNNNSQVKDVTRRYCRNYMTSTIKLRVDPDWWEETLLPFLPPENKLDKDEEKSLETMLSNQPLPHTVSGFKNHPLYALKRHLLKFEAIYPPDAPSVGFIRGEPIYPRECVCQLHSRETWLKEARVVRIGEEPYKIVKARPKWDKIAGVLRTDLPLEIFGFWQTEPYEPPIAVDGKVPRNEYGNVELFKPCMLPRGTVQLRLPGLNRIAKKLGIDCALAVVGFDISKCSVHPVYDGFIVCEEFKDTLEAAWEEEQENIRKREEEKREKRIYGNWKRLIRGLLIRERIKLKYDTK